MMYKIIESKYYKRKYLIVFNGSKKDEEFLVSEDLMIEYRLVKGKELDKKQYSQFKESFKRDEIYQKVLHYALYKQRCTFDIKQFLDKKEVYQERQNYYLEKLRKSRILDDKNYTYNYIHEAFEFKMTGPKKIIYDLSRKKISEELYQPIIASLSNKEIEANVVSLYQKKLKSIKNKSAIKAVQDIKQFIIKKGYSFELVNKVVNSLKNNIADIIKEDDALEKDYLKAKNKYSKDKQKEYNNILSYLMRKGYNYSKIKQRMEK